MKPIIRVKDISKLYKIGSKKAAYGTLRDAFVDAMWSTVKRRRASYEESTIWALKDVSFDVMPGEVVGIIGRNGAGKSTLLKILSRITEPTTGEIDIYGRVGSLLEVGTGFHQELSGRENVYLNGAVLGMKRREIDRKFDEIVDFAEVDKFIDTPVKHYSSGMYMRLAFAVAAHLEPEVLLIDEVLAVGDYKFQQKCLAKTSEISQKGRTVFIVSHNLGALGGIASHALWMDQGLLRKQGDLKSVIQSYVSQEKQSSGQWVINEGEVDSHSTAFISKIEIHQHNTLTDKVFIEDSFEFELSYVLKDNMDFCRVGVLIYNSTGTVIFSTADTDDPTISPVNKKSGQYVTKCKVYEWLLAPDTYFVTLHIDDKPKNRLFTADRVCSFQVVENKLRGFGHVDRPGVVAPILKWTLDLI